MGRGHSLLLCWAGWESRSDLPDMASAPPGGTTAPRVFRTSEAHVWELSQALPQLHGRFQGPTWNPEQAVVTKRPQDPSGCSGPDVCPATPGNVAKVILCHVSLLSQPPLRVSVALSLLMPALVRRPGTMAPGSGK